MPRYVATILEDIARCNFADVVLAAVLEPADPRAERLAGLVHELYVRADRLVGGDSDPLVECEPWVGLSGVERLDVTPGATGEPWLPEKAIEELRRRDLDVVLRFCTPLPRGDVLRAARYGLWSYHFGADADARNGTPFFEQHAQRAPSRDVLLEVLEDVPGRGLVLCRSRFGTRGNVFLAPYRQVAFWETTHFVVWKLHDLHELGWAHVRAHALPALLPADCPGIAPAPSTTDVVKVVAPRMGSALLNRVRSRRRVEDPWRMGLRRAAQPFGSTREHTSLEGFRWLETPGHTWADPFLWERDGATFLFFEDLSFERGYAVIASAEVREDCSLARVTTCLDVGHHLSFPYVFQHQGETFMIPESLADGTVTLYRAQRFPDEWVKEKVLFRGNATDTTFWQQGASFFFFTTLHDRDDGGMKGMLFVADSLTGEWRLHPSNPVSSDVRESRNAGAIFRRNGRLFRPTQNCGPMYGYGLNLREIAILSEDRFEERPWCSVGPDALAFPALGVHTYNFCRDIEAIDCRVPGT